MIKLLSKNWLHLQQSTSLAENENFYECHFIFYHYNALLNFNSWVLTLKNKANEFLCRNLCPLQNTPALTKMLAIAFTNIYSDTAAK
jgi:hypothetical protein